MRPAALLLAFAACGGETTFVAHYDGGAGVDPPVCFGTEYGCSFCIADAAPGACGNIGRFEDDGGVDLGCCLGATPYCLEGVCVQRPPTP